MNVSLNELVLLSLLGNFPAMKKDDLAFAAERFCGHPQFDRAVALNAIDGLMQRRLVNEQADKRVSITREGHAAVLNAMPQIEQLRAYMAGTSYRYVR